MQQKAEVNKLELSSQLGQTREELLLEYFENEMRAPSSAKLLLANIFISTEGHLLFVLCLAGFSHKEITSCNKLIFGDKGLHVYRTVTQYVFRDNSGLSPATRKDDTCFLIYMMSVIFDAVIQARYQRATKNRALKTKILSVILNVYQNAWIEKDDDSRQTLENQAIDEIRRFSNKK